MTLALAFLLLLVTVPVAGGRLSRLGVELQIRGLWSWCGVRDPGAARHASCPSGDETLHRIAHLVTYGLAAACILRNLELRFMWVVAAGRRS